MKSFAYRALDDTGRLVAGVVTADDGAAIPGLLLRRRLHLVALDESGNGDEGAGAHTIALDARLRALRATVDYMHAGLAVDVALRLVERSETNLIARNAIGEARRMMAEGDTPASALLRAGLAAPLHSVLLSAGQRAGQLQVALAQLVKEAEYEEQLKRRLVKTLMYPAVLLCTGFATVAVLVVVVVPRFALLAESMGQPLPTTLRVIMEVRSTFMQWGWLVLAAVAAGAIFAARRGSRRLPSRARTLLRRLPMLRSLVRTWDNAARLRALGAMLAGGVALLQAMQHVRASSNSVEGRDAMSRVIERLVAGEPLVPHLIREGLAPGVVAPLLEIGEGSGTLGAAFTKSAIVLQQRAEEQVDAILTLVQPLLILILGAAIAILAGGLLQSVYALRPSAAI